MVSGYAHGRAVAEMGLRVLGGESPASIPVISSPEEPPKFDYQVLMQLGINQKLLPPDSIVVNGPSPFYSINRHQFWTIIISLLILSMVLVILVINIWERKQIEIRIKNQLSFLRTLMDTLPLPIYFTERSGAIAGINRAFGQWFGLPWDSDEDLRTLKSGRFDSRFSPLLDRRMDSYETQILHCDGSMRPTVLHKATYADALGKTRVSSASSTTFPTANRPKTTCAQQKRSTVQFSRTRRWESFRLPPTAPGSWPIPLLRGCLAMPVLKS